MARFVTRTRVRALERSFLQLRRAHPKSTVTLPKYPDGAQNRKYHYHEKLAFFGASNHEQWEEPFPLF